MNQEKTLTKTVLLRAWLYGVPAVFMAYPIFLFLTSREEVAFCRYLAAPSMVVMLVALLWLGRTKEAKEGLEALPDWEAIGKFVVFLFMLVVCLMIAIKVHRPQGCIVLFVILASSPISLVLRPRKRSEVPAKH